MLHSRCNQGADREPTISEALLGLSLLPKLLAEVAAMQSSLARLEARISAQPEKRKRFYNIKEAADELNLSVTSVRRLVDRNLLGKAAGTRKIQIPAAEIEAYQARTLL